ncbi:class I SAM-dependent methyltransferase (plasmid) [Aggregatilineales bacterium SYSU G02658]
MSRHRRLRVSTHGLRLARKLFRSGLVPYRYLYNLNKLAATLDDPIPLGAHFVLKDQRTYPADEWPCLHALPESGYTITPRTMQVILQEVSALQPSSLVEFGCGRSTICLAEWLRAQAAAGAHLYSIEQDREYVDLTQQALQRLGLDQHVTLLHAPLAAFTYQHKMFNCYHLSSELLERIAQRPIDFLLIDGPSGGGFNRFGTLVQMLPLLRSGAVFLMDDALRSSELEVARHWRRISGVHIDGVYLTDRGLLRGRVMMHAPFEPPTMSRVPPATA